MQVAAAQAVAPLMAVAVGGEPTLGQPLQELGRLRLAAPVDPVGEPGHFRVARMDGSGYPDGLAGQDIPLGARVIAACDAFTAMTSPRPHARQLSVAAAVAELRQCAGSHVDSSS